TLQGSQLVLQPALLVRGGRGGGRLDVVFGRDGPRGRRGTAETRRDPRDLAVEVQEPLDVRIRRHCRSSFVAAPSLPGGTREVGFVVAYPQQPKSAVASPRVAQRDGGKPVADNRRRTFCVRRRSCRRPRSADGSARARPAPAW